MKSSKKVEEKGIDNDLKERGDQASKEIAVILAKYKVDIGAQMVYEPTGIYCKPVIVDRK